MSEIDLTDRIHKSKPMDRARLEIRTVVYGVEDFIHNFHADNCGFLSNKYSVGLQEHINKEISK